MVNSGYSSSSDVDSDEERYGKENGKGKEHGKGNPRVRRGSEGYEIQSADREVLFQEYIRSQGDNPRKYNFYEPEPHSDSESDGEREGEGVELEEEEDPRNSSRCLVNMKAPSSRKLRSCLVINHRTIPDCYFDTNIVLRVIEPNSLILQRAFRIRFTLRSAF